MEFIQGPFDSYFLNQWKRWNNEEKKNTQATSL
jgi:hypothetical protein